MIYKENKKKLLCSSLGSNEVCFHLHISTGSVLFRAYWGVSVSAFHHVLKGPWYVVFLLQRISIWDFVLLFW